MKTKFGLAMAGAVDFRSGGPLQCYETKLALRRPWLAPRRPGANRGQVEPESGRHQAARTIGQWRRASARPDNRQPVARG